MTTTTILEPGQIEAAAGDIPKLLLPPADIFASRARRLRQLASTHALGDYLRFIARLVEIQHDLLRGMSAVPLADAELLAQCREYHMPPLSTAGWSRHVAWRGVLADLLKAMQMDAPQTAREVMAVLANKDAKWLENQAEHMLARQFGAVDLACAPFIGAALQVYWTYMASALKSEQVSWPELPNLCPVCGSHPVASVVRIGSNVSGIRYLQCSLCSSEWHVVRAKCSNCDNSKGIVYYSLEHEAGNKDAEVVRAESCPECKTYLKVMQMDKDPHAEAGADDLASLTLDLLMGDEGLSRSGYNLLMIHGAEDGK